MDELRQAPLRDHEPDERLFVPPDSFERALSATREGLNVLILGAYGSGKTSFLRQLQFVLRRESYTEQDVYADLSGAASVDKALQTLVALAGEALESSLPWNPPVPRPSETAEEFNTRAALSQLQELPPCRFFLDNAHPDTVAFPLFGVFRDRLWETPHRWTMAADVRDRPRILRPPADAFWEEVVEISFTRDQATELVARRLHDLPTWLATVIDEVGTNPRQVLRTAAHAARHGDDPSAALASRRAWHERLSELDERPAMLMDELQRLGPISASDRQLLDRLGWARTTLLRTLEQLEQQGLVHSWDERQAQGRPKRLFAAAEPGVSSDG
jgi:hypothetical protein